MVSIININDGIKELTCGNQSRTMSQNIEIWWVCLAEIIFVYPSYYFVNTILNHINIRVLLTRHESACMVHIIE